MCDLLVMRCRNIFAQSIRTLSTAGGGGGHHAEAGVFQGVARHECAAYLTPDFCIFD